MAEIAVSDANKYTKFGAHFFYILITKLTLIVYVNRVSIVNVFGYVVCVCVAGKSIEYVFSVAFISSVFFSISFGVIQTNKAW